MKMRLLCRNLGLITGGLMLMTLATPAAHAVNLLTYYNFNTEVDGAAPPFTSNAPGLQTTTLNNGPDDSFPPGQIRINATAGTTVNQWPADLTGAGGAIDLAGNTNTQFCFSFGAINTQGYTDIN